MDCHLAEKISLLIDGELGEEEAKETAKHLSTCDACQRAYHDFLLLREELNSYAAAPDTLAQRRALQRILLSEKPPFWRRSVRLPVPALALLLVAVVALAALLAFVRQAPTAPAKAETKPEKVLTKPEPTPGEQDVLDLARFDRGERAAIYKVRRTSQGEVEQ